MHNTSARTLHRLRRLVNERITPALHQATSDLTITHWEATGEPVTFEHAMAQEFTPFQTPAPWGRPWGTTWFRLTGRVPEQWALDDDHTAEVLIDLGFTDMMPGFQCEATVWTPDGRIIKGIEPLNNWVDHIGEDGSIDLVVEAASNPVVPDITNWTTPTRMGDKATAGDDQLYTFGSARVALLHRPLWQLAQDLWTLQGLHDQLPETSTRRAQLLACFEDMLSAADPHDIIGTVDAARAALAPALEATAGEPSHHLHAIGHAHIDSAWLWPTRETRRKCARTFSNVLDLMDRDPDFTFACSSAQQYAWIQEDYPELFERIRARVTEGRFVPVGGMWVESDTNMPGGEALARQFVEGTRYFMEHFDVEPLEVWLPDSFGYTAAMPQIARAAGKKYFLTQKISWNDTNTFPHHSFDWEGIDGTRILTHFPPSDTYNATVSAEELARSERQMSEKGRHDEALLLFGFGDGGGGPTREMLAAVGRTRDLAGSPRVELSTPRRFFERLDAEYANRPVWTGEMYLEYHRGTYTSQHRIKDGNRRSEALLHEAELWASTAAVRVGHDYPADELRRLWRLVLLQQFHDILPGSSIAWVNHDSESDYAHITQALEKIVSDSLDALAGDADQEVTFNSSPFPHDGVPAMGASGGPEPKAPVVNQDGKEWTLSTDQVEVRIDERGLITSLVDRANDRQVLPPGMPAGLLHLFTDVPNEWDAWDINHFYRDRDQELVDVDELEATADGLRIVRRVGGTTITQTITLDADSPSVHLDFDIDWHERQKMLKLDLPVDVHTGSARSEIQFGHISRPTHENTSWDAARFETVAHRWVQVEEPGYGVAVANLNTYGHEMRRITREGGGSATLIRPTLLRAPLFPDPEADQGQHRLGFTITLGATVQDAVRSGYERTLPLRRHRGAPVEPLVVVEEGTAVVETVKLAEDGSGDVVVRLYEALGTRTRSRLRLGMSAGSVDRVDLLERPLDQEGLTRDGEVLTLGLRPFELVTLRISRS